MKRNGRGEVTQDFVIEYTMGRTENTLLERER